MSKNKKLSEKLLFSQATLSRSEALQGLKPETLCECQRDGGLPCRPLAGRRSR